MNISGNRLSVTVLKLKANAIYLFSCEGFSFNDMQLEEVAVARSPVL